MLSSPPDLDTWFESVPTFKNQPVTSVVIQIHTGVRMASPVINSSRADPVTPRLSHIHSIDLRPTVASKNLHIGQHGDFDIRIPPNETKQRQRRRVIVAQLEVDVPPNLPVRPCYMLIRTVHSISNYRIIAHVNIFWATMVIDDRLFD